MDLLYKMYMNECKQFVLNEEDAVNAMLGGSNLKYLVTEDTSWVEKFNSFSSLFEMDGFIESTTPSNDKNEYFINCINNWYMPNKYKQLNIENYILSLCTTEEETNRVSDELKLYQEKNLYTLLKFLIYFVDTLRENNIIWGVGRGSSVSSYILYLIGIHRVNSIKYDLDIGEFLK